MKPGATEFTGATRLRREHGEPGKHVYTLHVQRTSRPSGLIVTDPCCGVVLVDVGNVRTFDGAPVASVATANAALQRTNTATASPGVPIVVVFDRDPGADAFLMLTHEEATFPAFPPKHYPGRW